MNAFEAGLAEDDHPLTHLERAQDRARRDKRNGWPLSAHCIMMSAYLAERSQSRTRFRRIAHYTLGLWHAQMLVQHWDELNCEQLDALLHFMLKVRPVFFDKIDLLVLIQKEIELAQRDGAKPHKLGWAYLTAAEVAYAKNFRKESLVYYINKTLALVPAIYQETDQPQGLRQLVRIYWKIGELYGLPQFDGLIKARLYIGKACELARGAANAPEMEQEILAAAQKIRRGK